MKKTSAHKGFTLIELLVVVAIIGILASIILASLSSARGKARLSRAQSELSSLRAAQELYYSNTGSYDGLFADPSTGIKNLVDSIHGYDANAAGQVSPSTNPSEWAFAFTDGTNYYCADSNGYSGKNAGALAGSVCTPFGSGGVNQVLNLLP